MTITSLLSGSKRESPSQITRKWAFLTGIVFGLCLVFFLALLYSIQPVSFTVSRGFPCKDVAAMSNGKCEEGFNYTVSKDEAIEILGQVIKYQGGFYQPNP